MLLLNRWAAEGKGSGRPGGLLLADARDAAARDAAKALGAELVTASAVDGALAPPRGAVSLAEARELVRRRACDPEVLERLHREGERQRAVVFCSYALFATAVLLVPERAVLVALADDPAWLALPPYRAAFHAPRAIGYRDDAERALVQRATRNEHVPHALVGRELDPERLRALVGLVP